VFDLGVLSWVSATHADDGSAAGWSCESGVVREFGYAEVPHRDTPHCARYTDRVNELGHGLLDVWMSTVTR